MDSQCRPLQVDFRMEPVRDPLAANLCVPGWASRSVSRADQAYFDLSSRFVDAVIIKNGDDDLDIEVSYLGTQDSPQFRKDVMESVVAGKLPHLAIKMHIQCLVPLDNIKEKIQEDMKNQRAAIEKQVKTTLSNMQKAKAKAKKGPKNSKREKDSAQANGVAEEDIFTKQEKSLFETLGVDLPTSKEESVTLLQDFLNQENKANDLIQKAKDTIKEPTSLPLSRLQGEDEKTKGNRAKLMQQALESAQQSMKSQSDSSTSVQEVQFGFQAACAQAEREGTVPKAKAGTYSQSSYLVFVTVFCVGV